MENLLLASSSPRRKDLLNTLGIPFESIHPDIDESVFDHLEPEERVLRLAQAKAYAGKALALSRRVDIPRLLLAADTLVMLPGGAAQGGSASDEGPASAARVIGKPEDREDARKMLSMEAGRVQLVFTGLCLLDLRKNTEYSALSRTSVKFSAMTADEIERYLDSGEWEGAAGAYRMQGRGSFFIERIEGAWSGVVGLPIRELYGILRQSGYEFGL